MSLLAHSQAGTVPATRAARLFGTSIGKKLIVAVTGVVLSGFVLGHMVGNLTVFQGEAAINAYAAGLRKIPPLLWALRAVLLASVVLHFWAFISLWRQNWSARPSRYRVTAWEASTLASRAMRVTGPLLAAFIVYHLLHLTTGTVHPDFRDFQVLADGSLRADTYHNLITGLRPPLIAAIYLVALAALGLHVFHGVWSLFQTLGFNQPRQASAARRLATCFAIIVCGGFAIVPIAVLTGFLR